MKFTIVDEICLLTEAVDSDVIAYFTDPNTRVEAKVTIDVRKDVWCRPCDVKRFFHIDSHSKDLLNIRSRGILTEYNTFITPPKYQSTQEVIESIGVQNVVCLITTSLYVRNKANVLFMGKGQSVNNRAESFKWLREATIEDGSHKVWYYAGDTLAALSDLACAAKSIGIRPDTELFAVINKEMVPVNPTGIRKVKMRRRE